MSHLQQIDLPLEASALAAAEVVVSLDLRVPLEVPLLTLLLSESLMSSLSLSLSLSSASFEEEVRPRPETETGEGLRSVPRAEGDGEAMLYEDMVARLVTHNHFVKRCTYDMHVNAKKRGT